MINRPINEYIGEIIREGFTPTHCHYFVLNIVNKPTYVKHKNKTLVISSVQSRTIVIFMDNPLHKLVTQCQMDNTQIIVKGAWITQPTGFRYTPHVKNQNGTLQPLECWDRNENNELIKRTVICNTISQFVFADEIGNAESIMNNQINKLKPFKIN